MNKLRNNKTLGLDNITAEWIKNRTTVESKTP
jgi:hypothetical protein